MPEEYVHQIGRLFHRDLFSCGGQFEVIAHVYRVLGRPSHPTFRDDDWTMSDAIKTGVLEIIVRPKEVRHRLLVRELEAYVERTGGNTKQLQHRTFVNRLLRGGNDESGK